LSATVVLTLVLAIGASTSLFTLFDSVLLRPLPFPQADRLVSLSGADKHSGGAQPLPLSPRIFGALVESSQSFASLAALVADSDTLFALAGEPPERIRGAIVSADFFRTLGVEAIHGTTFESDDDQQVVVLSEGLWRRRFAGDLDVLGSALLLNGRPYQVIGVLPSRVTFPEEAALWIPNPYRAHEALNLTMVVYPYFRVVGRLRPGVTAEQAQAETSSLLDTMKAQSVSGTALSTTVVPLAEEIVGEIRPSLHLALAAVAALFLVACCNVAVLLLVRNAQRRRELGVRMALGASHWQIARQVMAEGVLLAAAAAVVGVAVASWTLDALLALAPPELPQLTHASLDHRALLFALAAALFGVVLFATGPALIESRRRPAALLLGGTTVHGERSGHRLQRWFAILQVAGAVVLLCVASLLSSSYARLTRTDLGFDPRGVVVAKLETTRASFSDPGQSQLFFQQILEQLRASPEVTTVAATHLFFLSDGTYTNSLSVDTELAASSSRSEVNVDATFVSPGFFNTIGTALLDGNEFDAADRRDSSWVAIVDRELADKLWPAGQAVGRTLTFEGTPRRVVGVVQTTYKPGPLHARGPELYLPMDQSNLPWPFLTILVRSPTPKAAIQAVHKAVTEAGQTEALVGIRMLDEITQRPIARQRFLMTLLNLFAVATLLLAAIGVYGVVASMVRAAHQEFAIRIALGASRPSIFHLVARQGFAVTIAGVLLGAVGTLATHRVLSSLLFEISPGDPRSFFLASAAVIVVITIAILLPAHRATRTDPRQIL